MELHGLDCVDLVVSYTTIFLSVAKKCKFFKNRNHKYPSSSLGHTWTDDAKTKEANEAVTHRKGGTF